LENKVLDIVDARCNHEVHCLLNLNTAVYKTSFFNPLSFQYCKVKQQFRFIVLQPSR